MHDRNGPGGALAAATKPDINNPDLSYSLPVFFLNSTKVNLLALSIMARLDGAVRY
jgi:hypothetical protein